MIFYHFECAWIEVTRKKIAKFVDLELGLFPIFVQKAKSVGNDFPTPNRKIRKLVKTIAINKSKLRKQTNKRELKMKKREMRGLSLSFLFYSFSLLFSSLFFVFSKARSCRFDVSTENGKSVGSFVPAREPLAARCVFTFRHHQDALERDLFRPVVVWRIIHFQSSRIHLAARLEGACSSLARVAGSNNS